MTKLADASTSVSGGDNSAGGGSCFADALVPEEVRASLTSNLFLGERATFILERTVWRSEMELSVRRFRFRRSACDSSLCSGFFSREPERVLLMFFWRRAVRGACNGVLRFVGVCGDEDGCMIHLILQPCPCCAAALVARLLASLFGSAAG
jgi:hypothetical protein